jgi:hypothetical protein
MSQAATSLLDMDARKSILPCLFHIVDMRLSDLILYACLKSYEKPQTDLPRFCVAL